MRSCRRQIREADKKRDMYLVVFSIDQGTLLILSGKNCLNRTSSKSVSSLQGLPALKKSRPFRERLPLGIIEKLMRSSLPLHFSDKVDRRIGRQRWQCMTVVFARERRMRYRERLNPSFGRKGCGLFYNAFRCTCNAPCLENETGYPFMSRDPQRAPWFDITKHDG